MPKKYQPRMPDGSYYHKSKSGAAKWPWDRLTYSVRSQREEDHHELRKRIQYQRKKDFLQGIDSDD